MASISTLITAGIGMASSYALAGRARQAFFGGARHVGLLTILAWLSRLMRDSRGVSAVELGLSAALILPPLASVFDIGMAYSEQIKLQQAVQAGAQYASMNVWDSSTSPTAITNTVTNALPPGLQSALSIATPAETCACPTGTTSPYIQSTDSLSTCGTTTCSDGEVSSFYVTVAGQLIYTPIAPYSFVFMNNPQTVTATSIVRVQ